MDLLITAITSFLAPLIGIIAGTRAIYDRQRKLFFSIFIVAIAVLATVGGQNLERFFNQRQGLTITQKENLEEEVRGLQSELATVESELQNSVSNEVFTSVQNENIQLEQSIVSLEGRLTDVNAQLNQAENELSKFSSERESFRKQLSDLESQHLLKTKDLEEQLVDLRTQLSSKQDSELKVVDEDGYKTTIEILKSENAALLEEVTKLQNYDANSENTFGENSLSSDVENSLSLLTSTESSEDSTTNEPPETHKPFDVLGVDCTNVKTLPFGKEVYGKLSSDACEFRSGQYAAPYSITLTQSDRIYVSIKNYEGNHLSIYKRNGEAVLMDEETPIVQELAAGEYILLVWSKSIEDYSVTVTNSSSGFYGCASLEKINLEETVVGRLSPDSCKGNRNDYISVYELDLQNAGRFSSKISGDIEFLVFNRSGSQRLYRSYDERVNLELGSGQYVIVVGSDDVVNYNFTITPQ